jgi:hypothetical protein
MAVDQRKSTTSAAEQRGFLTVTCCQAWEDHLGALMYELHLPNRQCVLGEAVTILSELAGCPAPPRLTPQVNQPTNSARLDRKRLKKRVVGD